MEAAHLHDPPSLLAVRRAGLTAGGLAHLCCDDSYGELACENTDAMGRFSSTGWRAAGACP